MLRPAAARQPGREEADSDDDKYETRYEATSPSSAGPLPQCVQGGVAWESTRQSSVREVQPGDAEQAVEDADPLPDLHGSNLRARAYGAGPYDSPSSPPSSSS